MSRPLKVPKPWRKPKKKLTQKRVRELFDYDETTGDLIKKVATRGPNGKVGSIIRTKDSNGYYQVMVDGWVEMVHRVVWIWWYGKLPKYSIDHINYQKCDNRISNLRDIPHFNNVRSRPPNYMNKTGVSGVRWVEEEGKYQVCIGNPSTGNLCTFFRTKDIAEAVCFRYALEQCMDYHINDWDSSAFNYLVDNGILK